MAININRLSAQMQAAVETALIAVGEAVAGQASELTPVDTGRLKGSITYATRTKQSKPRAPATSQDGIAHDGSENTVLVGTNVEYAPYMEYGTVRTPAQPFLRRSLEVMKDDIPKIFSQTLEEALGRQ